MSKKITMTARPKAKAKIDKWVETRESAATRKPDVKPKRLTIDIDPSLHKRLKMSCVNRDIQIADLIRTLIECELVDQEHLIADR
ncbi:MULTISPECIES: plasmid partition protein ParG [Rhodopirellula]|uniref:plasmid partition protein ParG n=1 Tax=Rhodopirellula TaxID=265488 RepID=UPI00257A0688|nr:plasmid partition protein ParG [Rhodopirellula sp. UBA1907]|tara:strand:+ start:571 stop:825 length:255 start_codon:yes stop_codon:yes gene_type:complete